MSRPNFLNLVPLSVPAHDAKSFSNSSDRGQQLASVGVYNSGDLFLLLPYVFPQAMSPMWYLATDSVFQPPMLMISSPAVPGRYLLRGPPTRKESIGKWLGSSAALNWSCSAVVIRAAQSGRLPRPPSAEPTGEKVPGEEVPPYTRKLPGSPGLLTPPPPRCRLEASCITASWRPAS